MEHDRKRFLPLPALPALPVLVAVAVAGACAPPAVAGALDRALEDRWRGAWVVTAVPTASRCDGRASNVAVIDGRALPEHPHRFERGEIAQVRKVDAKRGGRVDVHLALAEPLLEPYRDGPFTLYRELSCEVELEIDVERALVREDDVDALDAEIGAVLERHASRAGAEASPAWNERRRADYPPDYDITLAEHRAWAVERRNAIAAERIDDALDFASWQLRAARGDDEHRRGFALGVESVASVFGDDCDDWWGRDLDDATRSASWHAGRVPGGLSASARRGFIEGQRLAWAVRMAAGLRDCVQPVPSVPAR